MGLEWGIIGEILGSYYRPKLFYYIEFKRINLKEIEVFIIDLKKWNWIENRKNFCKSRIMILILKLYLYDKEFMI